eukprot:CAMPEP_0174958512 /NCGR_PEP_ID=MMETSP0004_2-20121128/2665_1 /TAXON_ID=420556 /ORGANISM="Ochromonas sp., Strain CCMP1393" /LENGTH=120 /DNA_ID=CAMNT_0016206733 /DNA_START=674 /DNA_END=1035 /DNA_ORIENTATION=-
MRREVIYGEISPNPLEHTNSCAVNLSPHRRTTSFHEAWSEAVAKDVLGHFDTLCPTCRSLKATWMVRPVFRYPTPVMRKWMRRHNVIALEEEECDEQEGQDPDKFRQILALEGALITWTK